MAAQKTVTASHRLTVVPAPKLAYPELFLSVYLTGNKWEKKQFAEMFVQAGCNQANGVDEADLVVFAGGPDVSPILYGEKEHETTRCSVVRDIEDIELYYECLKKGIPMFGVCRGAQFLHVMNNGKLWQDVDKHMGDHNMLCLDTGFTIMTSSVHHQQVMFNRDYRMERIANTYISNEKWAGPGDCTQGKTEDIEAFFYRSTMCLGTQGHPEYRGYEDYTRWCLNKIDEYILRDSDVHVVDNLVRLDPDVVAQRDMLWQQNGISFPTADLIKDKVLN